MVELVDAYAHFMASTDIPKLFINADPVPSWWESNASSAAVGPTRLRSR